MNYHDNGHQRHHIYTITQLTDSIKNLLEDAFPFIWVTGEISNYRQPVSGHSYFTLKDESAQINAVMFKGQTRNLSFGLEDGLKITGLGRISVYEPRGNYQLILEYAEPGGVGALMVAFDQLKKKLSREGLFEEHHKRPLPSLPKKISLVTSPTGSVVHDFIHIVHRRFDTQYVEIVPVKVQGDDAVEQIVNALNLLTTRNNSDIIVLARGGGSLEDMHAFNSEPVARAIFNSSIPVVSAVGHETDYCISDFVADLRAPTPSAAAELTVPLKTDLNVRLKNLSRDLTYRIHNIIENHRHRLLSAANGLIDPRKRVQDHRLRVDDYITRLTGGFQTYFDWKRERLHNWRERLNTNNPSKYVSKINMLLNKDIENLKKSFKIYIEKNELKLRELSNRLDSASPQNVLSRGYSITRTVPGEIVVRDNAMVHSGQPIEIILAKGRVRAKID